MGNHSIINKLGGMRIQAAQGPTPQKTAPAECGKKGKGFNDLLKEAVEEVNKLQMEVGETMEKLAVGEGEGIHEAMVALEKAGVSFRMLMQVRNKVLATYQEIMRMQM